MKPTKEQFEDFVRIRNSGMTNMLDTQAVCMLSDTGLTKEICLYIFKNFTDLACEYGVEI